MLSAALQLLMSAARCVRRSLSSVVSPRVIAPSRPWLITCSAARSCRSASRSPSWVMPSLSACSRCTSSTRPVSCDCCWIRRIRVSASPTPASITTSSVRRWGLSTIEVDVCTVADITCCTALRGCRGVSMGVSGAASTRPGRSALNSSRGSSSSNRPWKRAGACGAAGSARRQGGRQWAGFMIGRPSPIGTARTGVLILVGRTSMVPESPAGVCTK